MSTTLPPDRYLQFLELAEAHYTHQGFVKWSDIALELGVSRQRVLQLAQISVTRGYITEADLDHYRSTASRRSASRYSAQVRREMERLKLSITLTPENLRWLDAALEAAQHGTTRNDLINTAITQYRTANA